MFADPPESRFDEDNAPGGLGEHADPPGADPIEDHDAPLSSIGESLDLSLDSDDEHLFVGDEIDIDAQYKIATDLANKYDTELEEEDIYVDFEHRERDDNDPVFTQPPDWTTDPTYLLEVECNTVDDYDNMHHLVMANVRANLPSDYNLEDNEGFITSLSSRVIA